MSSYTAAEYLPTHGDDGTESALPLAHDQVPTFLATTSPALARGHLQDHNIHPFSTNQNIQAHLIIPPPSSVLRDDTALQQPSAPATLEVSDATRPKPATIDAMADKEIEKGDEGESFTCHIHDRVNVLETVYLFAIARFTSVFERIFRRVAIGQCIALALPIPSQVTETSSTRALPLKHRIANATRNLQSRGNGLEAVPAVP